MSRSIIVGTRGSQLAVIQAESVVAMIREANPNLKISLKKIVTAGDRHRRTQPAQMGTAVFVKELEEALLEGRIDLAVHSLKDMPTEIPQGLCILAVTERLDPRDVLVAKAKLNELPPGARIGTGSLRRSVQLSHYRPDLRAYPIRGNIDTRLHKVAGGDFDGVILAAAAMLRLGWEDKITEYLPLEHFLPAAGQGALAVEARLDDAEISRLISPLNHLPTWQCVTAERAFLRKVGGGCRTPMAALGTVNGSTLRLEGMMAALDGRKMLRASEEDQLASAAETGVKLAKKMQAMGASEIIAEARLI
jgi:hydroxymethylbilane synthase